MNWAEQALQAMPYLFAGLALAAGLVPDRRAARLGAAACAALGAVASGWVAAANLRPAIEAPGLAAVGAGLALLAAGLCAHVGSGREAARAPFAPLALGVAACLAGVQQANDLPALLGWLSAAELLRISAAALAAPSPAAVQAARREFALRTAWLGLAWLGLALGASAMRGPRLVDLASALDDPRAALAMGLMLAALLVLLSRPQRAARPDLAGGLLMMAADGAAVICVLALCDCARLAGSAVLAQACGWGGLAVFALCGLAAKGAATLPCLAASAWRGGVGLAVAAWALATPALAAMVLAAAAGAGAALLAGAGMLGPEGGWEAVRGAGRRRPWAAAWVAVGLASLAAAPGLAGFANLASLTRALFDSDAVAPLLLTATGQALWCWTTLRAFGVVFSPAGVASVAEKPQRAAWGIGAVAAMTLVALGLASWPVQVWP